MGGERKTTGGGAMSAVRGTAAALAVTGLLFLLPGLLVPGPEAKGDGQAAVGGENAPSGTAAAVPTGKRDGGRTVRLLKKDGTVEERTMADYLWGVVAAEMPASWPPEALACQAIAARTRAVGSSAVYGGNGCALHPEADVCTDSACCQGWLSPEARKASWGDGALPCEKRVRQAVSATAGQVLTYDGAPIEVLYHASSGGQTEDAAEVFAMRVPYLQSVASPGEEGYDGYAREQRFTLIEAAAKLSEAFPDSGVEADTLPAQLELLALTDTGRVKEMRVGSVTVTGRDVRQALGLRSTMFTWECQGKEIIFSVRGYGHGVGMSQAGACAMAAAGAAYEEILAHYYPGTTLTTVK